MRQNEVVSSESNSVKQLSRADLHPCSAANGTPTVGALFLSRLLNWKHLDEALLIGVILGASLAHVLLGETWVAVIVLIMFVYGALYLCIRFERGRGKKHPGPNQKQKCEGSDEFKIRGSPSARPSLYGENANRFSR